jgi:exonuclease VII small subunit
MKFELNSLPRNCSDEEIIAEIKRVDSLLGKNILVTQDFNKFAKMKAQSISKRFGGWEKALMAAGLEHKYSGVKITSKMKQQSKKLTDEEVLQELKRIAQKLGQDFVTQANVTVHSDIISGSTVVYRFGSWENGTKKAGLENSPGYKRKFSDEEYFENLLNVWTHYGRQPKYGEMKKPPSLISPKTYESHFGTWRKALEAFVKRMNREDDETEQVLKSNKYEEETNPETKKQITTAPDRRNISLGLRYKVMSRDKFKCVKCGSSPATNHNCQLQIDHIIPFSKGGKTILDNLQTLCENCNLGKGNRHFE